jgi:ribosomal protein S18 acetylase RimI-like enzyme
MEIEIVKAQEKYVDSHAECLDEVARERRFLAFLEGPPKNEVRAFVKNLIEKDQTQFYAINQNKSVGWCDILRRGAPTLSHSGILGMGIRKQFRGMGIGKKLISAAIEDAFSKGVQRVELWVFENNQNAIALYLKTGFKVEGKLEKYVKINGVFQSALLMAKVS